MHLVLAYIDPGSGSLLLQALIAGALTLPFVFRNAMRRTVARLKGRTVADQHGHDKPKA
jgi:hypothetical protein